MAVEFKRFITIALCSVLAACHGTPQQGGQWERVWAQFDHYMGESPQAREDDPSIPLEVGKPCVSSEVGEPGCD